MDNAVDFWSSYEELIRVDSKLFIDVIYFCGCGLSEKVVFLWTDKFDKSQWIVRWLKCGRIIDDVVWYGVVVSVLSPILSVALHDVVNGQKY